MRSLLSPRWIAVHTVALVLVVGFLLLGWWQVRRAAGGNLLSFGYAVEWPAFAAFVIFMWVKEIRHATARSAAPPGLAGPAVRPGQAGPALPAVRSGSAQPARTGGAYDDSGDPELAAYNRYLGWLSTHPEASPADYWRQPDRGGDHVRLRSRREVR